MSEEYHYVPQEVYTPIERQITTKKDELVEDFDVLDEAAFIVNTAFGNDYEHDIEVLNKERLHAEGCGCGKCESNYQERIVQVATKYVKTNYE